jgi:hypothetical protein
MLTEEVLESLNLSEREEFQRFMVFRAPGLRKEVGEAVEVLLKPGELTKEALHRLLFGTKPYDDKVVRYILTDINRLIYEFLAFKRMAADEAQMRSLLLEELQGRHCNKAFARTLNATLRQLDTTQSIGPDALKQRYDALNMKARSELQEGQRSTAHFEGSSAALDRFFVARKLQMSAEKLNIHYILNTTSDDPFLDILMQQVDNGRFNDAPYIIIYREVIRTLQDPDDTEAFRRLQHGAATHAQHLPQGERHDLYQHILNYCIRRINAGRLEFQSELFATYREALTHGALLTDGILSQWDFKNIVTIGLRLREAEFVEGFIEEYGSTLAENHRANAVAYNRANLHFHAKNYRQALTQLQRVDLDDVFYRLDARSILLKTYFEMDDPDALFYHASAFRTFLLRNRTISDRQRKVYQNLIRFTVSLARCGTDRHRIRALRKKVSTTPNVADLAWLEGKLAELLA